MCLFLAGISLFFLAGISLKLTGFQETLHPSDAPPAVHGTAEQQAVVVPHEGAEEAQGHHGAAHRDDAPRCGSSFAGGGQLHGGRVPRCDARGGRGHRRDEAPPVAEERGDAGDRLPGDEDRLRLSGRARIPPQLPLRPSGLLACPAQLRLAGRRRSADPHHARPERIEVERARGLAPNGALSPSVVPRTHGGDVQDGGRQLHLRVPGLELRSGLHLQEVPLHDVQHQALCAVVRGDGSVALGAWVPTRQPRGLC
mmetsp:Transcript_57581/g.135876  ORF Transcript_57581/g.135876 Transcript_57581/m.135876 type:complete len:255 (+) Transcript_57581:64-828(+)